MKQENFIPNRCDDLDSDDSSIHGDLINDDGEEFSEGESLVSDNDNDANFSGIDGELEGSSSEDTSEDDASNTEEDAKKSENCSKTNENNIDDKGDSEIIEEDAVEIDDEDADQEDDDNSDSHSTSSEEATATMGEIFGTTPNPEANRNHPPNFKTDSPILDLCFHPECELIGAASIDGDCLIYRYNLEKVENVATFSHHKKSCRQICYSGDGSLLYTVSKDKSLAVVDIQNSAIKLHKKNAHEVPIYSFLEVNDNLCATGDDDGTVKLWDLRKPDPILDFRCGEQTVTSLLTCEANKYLSATVADGSVTGFNLRKNRIDCQSEMFDGEFTCQALVRSDSRLVVGSGSGTIQIFNWGQFGFTVDSLSGHPDLIQCMVPITDNMIITGCEDGNIRAIHLYGHRFIGIVGQHKDFGVENLALSCDGNILASCSMDEEIQFWNIEYLYNKTVNAKKRGNKKISVATNLESSKKRNTREFFNDIPRKMESDDDEGGPVPCTSYDSD